MAEAYPIPSRREVSLNGKEPLYLFHWRFILAGVPRLETARAIATEVPIICSGYVLKPLHLVIVSRSANSSSLACFRMSGGIGSDPTVVNGFGSKLIA